MQQTYLTDVLAKFDMTEFCPRPDIFAAIRSLSRFNGAPGKLHWEGVLHVLKYLTGTIDSAVCYRTEAAQRFWVSAIPATSPVRTREEVPQVLFSSLQGVRSAGSPNWPPMRLSAVAESSPWHSPWQARRPAIFATCRWKPWEQQKCRDPSGFFSKANLPYDIVHIPGIRPFRPQQRPQ